MVEKISILGLKKIPVVPVTCHEKIRVGRSEKNFFLIIFFMVLAVLNEHYSHTTDTPHHRYIFPTVYGRILGNLLFRLRVLATKMGHKTRNVLALHTRFE